MLPLKRILCPTDFSDPAQAAVKSAIELTQHFSAQLLLVHVVPPVPVPYQPIDSPAPAFDITSYLQELVKASRETLQAYAEKHVPAELPVSITVAAGDPAYEILRLYQGTGGRRDCHRHPRARRLAAVSLRVRGRKSGAPG